MDKFLMNRFEYLTELTDDELIAERENSISEIQGLNDMLDLDINSEQRSEIENSDLPFEQDKLKAIEIIMESRGLSIKSR